MHPPFPCTDTHYFSKVTLCTGQVCKSNMAHRKTTAPTSELLESNKRRRSRAAHRRWSPAASASSACKAKDASSATNRADMSMCVCVIVCICVCVYVYVCVYECLCVSGLCSTACEADPFMHDCCVFCVFAIDPMLCIDRKRPLAITISWSVKHRVWHQQYCLTLCIHIDQVAHIQK